MLPMFLLRLSTKILQTELLHQAEALLRIKQVD